MLFASALVLALAALAPVVSAVLTIEVAGNNTLNCITPAGRTLLDQTDPGFVDSLYWFKWLANVAYCMDNRNKGNESECAKAESNGIPFSAFKPIYPGITEGAFGAYIGYIEQSNNGSMLAKPMVVLGFRGTSNPAEAIADLQAKQVPCSEIFIAEPAKCEVHGGFAKGFNALHEEVSRQFAIYHAKYPKASVRIVGHSLGGALSSLFAQDLARNYTAGPTPSITNFAVFTYGEPRAFTPNFAPYFRKLVPNTHRVVNFLDPVPQVPPNKTLVLGAYAHTSTPYFIFDNSTTTCSLDYVGTTSCILSGETGEDKDCQNTLWNFQADFSGEGLSATSSAAIKTAEWHYLDNYMSIYKPTTAFPGTYQVSGNTGDSSSTATASATSATATVTAVATTSSKPAGSAKTAATHWLLAVVFAALFAIFA